MVHIYDVITICILIIYTDWKESDTLLFRYAV